MNRNKFLNNIDGINDNDAVESLDYLPNELEKNPDPFQATDNGDNFEYNNHSSFDTYASNYQVNVDSNLYQSNFELSNETLTDQNNEIDDDELLKVFIKDNYHKYTTKKFNFAFFFFSGIFLAYRKLSLFNLIYHIIHIVSAFLLVIYVKNEIISFSISLVISILLSFYINKFYLNHARKKINKIKLKNINKSFSEISEVCAKKGGTSILHVFLYMVFAPILIIAIVALLRLGSLLFYKYQIDNKKYSVEKDVKFSEYYYEDRNYIMVIEKDNQEESYITGIDGFSRLDFYRLNTYSEHIKIDIYYINVYGKKMLADYKVYTKDTNEDITDIKDIDELEEKLNLKSKEEYYTKTFKVT